MILLLCVYGFIVVIDRTIQYLFLCVSVFVCNLFPFADEMSCCTGANTVFIGTTTTGSSLVHFKLYWVPACAALRLGSDARLK